MSSTKIMIIRHGEKPDDGGDPPISVLTPGDDGVNNLDPRGWQRAGALVGFFDPHYDSQGAPHIDKPASLFAAQANSDYPSLRTQQTIAPLAALLGLTPAYPAPPNEATTAAPAILAAPGPVLVCWEHKNIANLIEAITGDKTLAPHWSGKRFDMVLVLEEHHGKWTLKQVPQMLLAGDSEDLLKPRKDDQTS